MRSWIWLTDAKLTAAVVANLSTPQNQQALGIQEIFSGAALRDKFNDPTVDPRTPDIVLKVNTGVIFTGGTKLSEHGGFNEDDVHTALLVALPGVEGVSTAIATTNQQVAASVVALLGINPRELQAVQNERIQPLPLLGAADSDRN